MCSNVDCIDMACMNSMSLDIVAGTNELVKINGCMCEGSHQVYDCTVARESATIWTGTAFNCPATNNEIIFQHGANGAVNASCNEGAVSGYIIRANDSSYTSRLSIFVTPEVNGSRVSCFSDGLHGTVEIGSSDLTITTGTYNCNM